MSLLRTALRLAAVEALNSHPTIDQMCEGRVYDSRISDFNHREPVPVIILTTEEAKGEAWSANNGGAPFKSECDLVLEIAMNVITRAATKGGPVDFISAPETDPELEADLDVLEECALDILTVGTTPQARLLRNAILRRAPEFKSSRFATDETGTKLAIRLVTLRVELKNDGVRDARVTPTGPFANLPTPLRTVCEGLSADSDGLAICRRVAAKMPSVAPPRSAAAVTVAVNLAPTPTAPASDPATVNFSLDGIPS